jgi:hypothetical protein
MNAKLLIPLCAAALLAACGRGDEVPSVTADDPSATTPGVGDTATTPGGNAGDPSTTAPNTTSAPDAPPSETPPPPGGG